MPINKINKKKGTSQVYRVRVNYTDANGKPQQVERTVYGLNAAQLKEKELLLEYKQEQKAVSSKMTMQQLYDEYEVYHSHETRQSSHNKAMQILKTHVLPTMKDCRLKLFSRRISII